MPLALGFLFLAGSGAVQAAPLQADFTSDPALHWQGLFGTSEELGELLGGDFAGDLRRDAVVRVDGTTAVLVRSVFDRHGREELVDLSGTPVEVHSMARLNGGLDGRETLLTAGPDGALRWVWDESAQALEPGPFTAPGEAIAELATAGTSAGVWTLVYTLAEDRLRVTPHVFVTQSGEHFVSYPSFMPGFEIEGFAAADFDGDGVAEIACTSGGVLSVFDETGTTALQDFNSGSGGYDRASFAVLQDAGVTTEQLAWVGERSGQAELWTVSSAGVEGPLALALPGVRAMAAGDLDNDGRADLALCDDGLGTVHPLLAVKDPVAVPRFPGFGPLAPEVPVLAPEFLTIASVESAGLDLGDFDGDGDVDIVQTHQSQGLGFLLAHRSRAVHHLDAGLRLNFGLSSLEQSVSGAPYSGQLVIEPPLLPQPGNNVHLRVWNRPSEDSVSVAAEQEIDVHLPVSGWPVTVNLEFTPPTDDIGVWYVELTLGETVGNAEGPSALFMVTGSHFEDLEEEALPGEPLWGGQINIVYPGVGTKGTSGTTRVPRLPPPLPPVPPVVLKK